MKKEYLALMRLLQLSDSAFPVGAFSFSNGLETAAHEGLVYDAESLKSYARVVARQSAYTDGIASLHAHRAAATGDYEGLLFADRELLLCKMNDEARQMLCRMGKKCVELGIRLTDHPLLHHWKSDIDAGDTPGCYPVAQGAVFARLGIGREELFCSHQYGVIGTILNAALRCVKVSHYDTQSILFDLSCEAEMLYKEIKTLSLDDMNTFAPQTDILAALHEKGDRRMFMN